MPDLLLCLFCDVCIERPRAGLYSNQTERDRAALLCYDYAGSVWSVCRSVRHNCKRNGSDRCTAHTGVFSHHASLCAQYVYLTCLAYTMSYAGVGEMMVVSQVARMSVANVMERPEWRRRNTDDDNNNNDIDDDDIHDDGDIDNDDCGACCCSASLCSTSMADLLHAAAHYVDDCSSTSFSSSWIEMDCFLNIVKSRLDLSILILSLDPARSVKNLGQD